MTAGNAPENLFGGLTVGRLGNTRYRSVADFDISVLPDVEKVVSATLNLTPFQINIQDTGQSIGSIRHLDANAAGRPVDAFRFTWDDIALAPLASDLGLGGNFGRANPFDVTGAVAADHLAGTISSPFGLTNNPVRSSPIGYVSYSGFPQLVVTTASPDAVTYSLEPLGENRYRATYSLHDEVSLPLALIDINFDPALYQEESLSIVANPVVEQSWDLLLLGSGIGTPATFSLASKGAGLSAGDSVSGFQLEFAWLGEGLPSAQTFTVYDPQSFATLYSGDVKLVPLPGTVWLALSGLALLGVTRRHSRSEA